MNTKHTPGPWHYFQDGQQVMAKDHQMMVADIRGWGHLSSLYKDENKAAKEQDANGRLIAAAPELLAFAQMIANGGINQAGEFTIESEARALIAKATGTNI